MAMDPGLSRFHHNWRDGNVELKGIAWGRAASDREKKVERWCRGPQFAEVEQSL